MTDAAVSFLGDTAAIAYHRADRMFNPANVRIF